MELPDLGKNCAFISCKQLDFLPIRCVKCELFFCKDHCIYFNHKCTKIDEEKSIKTLDIVTSYSCTYNDCTGKELTPIICNVCSEQFCLKHRLPYDHGCIAQSSRKEVLTPQEKVLKITGKQLKYERPNGLLGKKSSKTASKVMEMKLKMKAKGEGSIPINEKIYFDVYVVPQNRHEPMFFSKLNSIGKIIDSIAAHVKLKNENHIVNSKKLKLYTEDDIAIPTHMKIENVLLSEEYKLENFGRLSLNYEE